MGNTQRQTRAASSARPDYASTPAYLRVALCGVSLRQGVPVGLLVLLDGVPAPMPPARGRVVELGPEAVLEVA